MAELNLNGGINDIRGRFQGWVYKRVNGKPVLAPMPRRSLKAPSEGQVLQRDAFANAAAYGRSVLGNPALRPLYDAVANERRKPVFAVAIGDFFTSPQVRIINVSGYHGHIGDKILVLATDDVNVMSVHVALKDANGTLIEQGAAIKTGEDWYYTASTVVVLGRAIKIDVTATDRPGNTGFRSLNHTVA
jgi:hypothetical protein